jgi:hypothetical protein
MRPSRRQNGGSTARRRRTQGLRGTPGEAKAAHEKARKACEGKKGEEGRDCMRREMCAQAKDPGKCEAR